MKKVFQTKNNDNFYHIKEIQWSNKAMKLIPLNAKVKNKNNLQFINPDNYLKEKSWNKRFIYNKIQNYDSAKDKNVVANFSKNDEMNCYHNALKKNDVIIKNFYSNNKGRKKSSMEYNKTNIKVCLNPMGKNFKKTKIINNSFSSNKINFNNNRMFSSDFSQAKKEVNDINKFLNTNQNGPDKLTRIWNDLCILEPYRELFNILATQLSDKNKEDFCEREFNELYELRNDLQLLSTSVYYRFKILENLNFLNDKLGTILRSKQTSSNEVILKKISKKIENLREHTVNICFLMQKIKSKINQGHRWGKYDLEAISEKFKFDKNYLIKMKEEMCVLKEGYAKYFFDIADDSNPFLLNASEPLDKKDKTSDPFFHYVPLSNEMRQNINQCIYIIYQELIGYQNSNVSENNFRNISPLKKYKYTELDIKFYKKQNESFNYSNIINNSLFSLSNNNIWIKKSGVISPSRTNYSGMQKSPKFGWDKNSKNIINKNEKRILSGNENEINKYNKILSKIDKISNDIENKTTNYNNIENKDLANDKNTINIDVDINNKKNVMNKENNKEEEKEKENKNENLNNKEENEIDDMNINNISNIKKEDNNINTKSEREEFDFNNEENNNDNIYKEKENGNIFIDNNINNKLEEIIEEEKVKSDSNRNSKYNKNEEIKDIKKNKKINEEIVIENQNGNNIINDINKVKSRNEKQNGDGDNIDDNENTENLEKQLLGNSKESNVENNKSNTNKSISLIKSKNLKISIFNAEISEFAKDFYVFYYTSIPQIIKNMFKIQEKIIQNVLTGISPYMLLVHEKSSTPEEQTGWINLKNSILGLCIFSFEYKNGIIKLIINHISTSSIMKDEDDINTNIDPKTFEQFKHIFNTLIEYIKKNFYFDEIIIEYNSDKANDNILNIFLNDLNFVVVNENDNEENESDNKEKSKDRNNEQYNKMVYTNDSTKNRVNDIIRQSIQKFFGKNIIDIFDSVIITNNTELVSLDKNKKNEGNMINNILTKYLLDKKERSNVNRIYNKIQNLDQLIKLFQNNNINNKEIPLSLAENRFDILCTVLNKLLFNSYFSNSTFFNNYNNNDSNSYLDKNSNIFYNFIKAEKVLILENDKYNINFCHILNNNLSIFFCKMNEDFSKYLNKNNIYTQINNVYKDTLSMNKKQVLDDKIIWIPCFEFYKHIRTLSNNSIGTIHEYIKISNQIIKQTNKEILRINANESEKYFIKIGPEFSRDFVLDDDFIFGIINDGEILNVKIFEKDKFNDNKDNEGEDNISEEIEGEVDNKEKPYIIFLAYVKKSEFIVNNIK